MQLSVVIVHYKVPAFLALCLDSVQKALADFEAEIIVVDNHSQDESAAITKELFPSVNYIALNQNIGFAKANNLGVNKASGEFVCILNPDTVVPEDCFKRLFEYYSKQKNPGIIGIRMLDGSGNFLPESKRNFPSLRTALYKFLNISSKKHHYYADAVAPKENAAVAILAGAFMFLSKEHYHAVCGFDETYFMYGEDIDLSYQMLLSGKQNYYFGTNFIIHFKGESGQKDKAYAQRFYSAMRIFFYKYSKGNFLSLGLVKLVTDVLPYFYPTKTNVKVHMPATENCILITKQLLNHPFFLQKTTPDRLVDISKTHWVFDTESLSYTEILQIIEQESTQNSTLEFAFYNAKLSLILGSSNKKAKGYVIKID
ncbi:MAG: glycosyltransferase family 2 protein [Flavobacteriaceae bacterium]|nr:glycosyltransferase family 2 protein [Flavobacteriaceae bacterium]